MRGTPAARVAVVVVALAVALTALAARLVELQWGRYEEFVAEAARNHAMRRTVKARRGDIVDRCGNLLATSVPCKTVAVDLFKLRNLRKEAAKPRSSHKMPPGNPEIAGLLAGALGLDAGAVRERLESKLGYVVVKRRVGLEEWGRVEALKLPAVLGAEDFQRWYPDGRNATHVVGFVDGEDLGQAGVEQALEERLRGIDGWYLSERTARGREIRILRKQDARPRNGYTVVLTLDQTLQQIAEEEADRAFAQHRPAGVCAIVARPRTGEILAMVNRPTDDPNTRARVDWEKIRNRCITDTFEPGSTLKVVTVAAALDQGLVDLETPVFCENGMWEYAGKPLHDVAPYGELSVRQVLQKSSNIGTVKVALRLGMERLHRFLRGFGIGEELLDGSIRGEVKGTLYPVARWSALSISRVPIGHEVAATPLQMLAAMSVIANGGVRVNPQLLREVRDERGTAVEVFQPRETGRVIAPEAAARVVKALEAVVSEQGTAKLARVPGFTVAGKTGTANKWDAALREYSRTRYLASFIGFLPAGRPELAILVMIDEPSQKEFYGGHVAAPVFAAMASRMVRHLDIEPEHDPAAVEVAAR